MVLPRIRVSRTLRETSVVQQGFDTKLMTRVLKLFIPPTVREGGINNLYPCYELSIKSPAVP